MSRLTINFNLIYETLCIYCTVFCQAVRQHHSDEMVDFIPDTCICCRKWL